MICVAYCRYSSENQRDGYSIEAQKRAINDWAKKEGHTIAYFYIDEARSGTSDDREQFQQMIKDSAKGFFNAVVVHKLDRFARDRYDSAMYKHKLKQNGVRLISVLEPLDETPESVILESLLEGMAEYYSKNLSREIKKGKTEVKANHLFIGGQYPFGYNVVDRHLQINEEEAKTVKYIFNEYLSGTSLVHIAKALNAKGLSGKRGKPFTPIVLNAILLNPVYYGGYRYRDPETKEYIVVPNVNPPILSESLWRATNAKRRRSKLGPRKKSQDYLLTGYIHTYCCNKCYVGSSSRYKTSTSKGSSTYTYRIYRRPDNIMGTCSGCNDLKFTIRKEYLEDFVIGSIKSVLLSESTIDWVVSECMNNLRKKDNASDRNKLLKELEEVKRKQTALLDVYLTCGLDKDLYAAKKEKLEQNEQDIKLKLYNAPTTDYEALQPSMIKTAIKNFFNSEDSNAFEFKKKLIATFLDSIIVYPEKLVLHFAFNIPGSGDTIEKIMHKDNHTIVRFALYIEYNIKQIYLMQYNNPLSIGVESA